MHVHPIYLRNILLTSSIIRCVFYNDDSKRNFSVWKIFALKRILRYYDMNSTYVRNASCSNKDGIALHYRQIPVLYEITRSLARGPL